MHIQQAIACMRTRVCMQHSTCLLLTCGEATSRLSRSRTITANVTVFPVPDLACTMRSAPSRPSGMAACCTGLGVSNPQARRLSTRPDGTMRSLNDLALETMSTVRCRSRRGGCGGAAADAGARLAPPSIADVP
eukprot:356209-Chlamydomonas_euryale.AAC.6